MKNRRLVFMNSGMHFWNREKEILAELATEYEILLIICHFQDNNYTLDDIIDYCKSKRILLTIIDNTSSRSRNPLNIIRAIKTVRTISKFRPNLIYLENFNDPYLAIFFTIFLNKNNVIISILDYELHPYERNKIRFSDKFFQIIYLTFFKNYQLFSSQQSQMMQKDYPSKNIFHIPLFLIKNDFRVINKSEYEQKELLNFLFFGKIYYYKGLDILINASNILASLHTNFRIIIAGYCDNFANYKKLIANQNIYELKLGYLSKDEIRELMMKADVFVLPYRQVTQSGPLMMAFNFGIIPLASDLNGFQELIKNRYNGFLFKNNSVDDLLKTMQEIILLSKAERVAIHGNLIKYVEETYNPYKFALYYKSMFDSVTTRK